MNPWLHGSADISFPCRFSLVTALTHIVVSFQNVYIFMCMHTCVCMCRHMCVVGCRYTHASVYKQWPQVDVGNHPPPLLFASFVEAGCLDQAQSSLIWVVLLATLLQESLVTMPTQHLWEILVMQTWQSLCLSDRCCYHWTTSPAPVFIFICFWASSIWVLIMAVLIYIVIHNVKWFFFSIFPQRLFVSYFGYWTSQQAWGHRGMRKKEIVLSSQLWVLWVCCSTAGVLCVM